MRRRNNVQNRGGVQFFINFYLMFLFLAIPAFSEKRIFDKYGRPLQPQCEPLFYDNFTDPFVMKRWHASRTLNFDGKWINDMSYPLQGRPGEKGLIIKNKQKSHIISNVFPAPIYSPNDSLVIQFESRAQLIYTCFSTIMRIHTSEFDPYHQTNETEHFIEFGPETCRDVNKAVLNLFSKDKEGETVKHELKDSIHVPVNCFSKHRPIN